MALTNFPPFNYNSPFDNTNVSGEEYAIGGKMVTATMEAAALAARMVVPDDVIKEHLTRRLIEFMITNKLVEFTKVTDPKTFTDVFRARCFVTPDTQVRILRLSKKV